MEEQAQQAQNIKQNINEQAGAQSATETPSATGWWKRMRAPGVALTYSMEKRHVPDVDAEKSASGGQKNAGNNSSSNGNGNSNGQSKQASAGSGASNVMQCNGSCTVRYFDLAVGAVAMLMLCGMMKCVCGCCRCMKR